MNCMYFRIRSKKYQRYFYCEKNDRTIDFKDCRNCKDKCFKPVKELKKKSSKLKKLESKRFSIITDNLKVCYICEKNKKRDLHEIFGGSNRQKSMEWGLVIPICGKCHDKWKFDKELRQTYQGQAQRIFEEKYSHELFMKEFRKNFIKMEE